MSVDHHKRNSLKMSSAGSSVPWANPQKEGYLCKRGHVVKNWKKRWFRVKNDMLYYFKERTDPEPVDEVPLKRSEVAPTTKINKPFCFELNAKAIEKVRFSSYFSLSLAVGLCMCFWSCAGCVFC